MAHYKIGTRNSLLAMTQANEIKDLLTRVSEDTFELVGMTTKGDQILDRPLHQIEGKDFFTKEVDDALLDGRVDLIVNSYKDLSMIRPVEFTTPTISKRYPSNDLLLLREEIVAQLGSLAHLKIGTSSPRRTYLLEKHLADFLPHFAGSVEVNTLRGNLITRLKKLQNSEFDGIVLAFAGLERLAGDATAHSTLLPLLKGLRPMILPLSIFPGAPAQGAIAIECLKTNHALQEILVRVHDEESAYCVHKERESFKKWGGGCHLPLGISVKKTPAGHRITESGCVDHRPHYRYDFLEPRSVACTSSSAHIYIARDDLIEKKLLTPTLKLDQTHLYLTSKNTFHILPQITPSTILWSAGDKSMRELATLGHFVTGCADSLSDKEILTFLFSYFFQLLYPQHNNQVALVAEGGSSQLFSKVSVYERLIKPVTTELKKKIEESTHFYWMSFPQYELYLSIFPSLKNKLHSCGPGKTYEQFREHNIEITPFLSPTAFENFYKKG